MLGITDYLWRLIPANPILLRVVENGGKRRRDLIIRCAYLGLLILVVLFSLYSKNVSDASLAELAKTSANVFETLSYWQLGLVALLAPVFTAGAITQERDSQTYDILLSTPLSNGQIVLGSLLSRLFFIVILLVSGIPVFAITQIFGGVAIRNILVSFLIAAATAFVTGSLAMAIATFKVGSRRTIFGFYLFIIIYLVGLAGLDQLAWFHPIIGYDPDPANNKILIPVHAGTSWLTAFNPLLALKTLFVHTDAAHPELAYLPPEIGKLPPDLQRWPIGWLLSSPASFYITLMFTLSFLMTTPSVMLLRWLAQTNMPFKTWIMTKLHLSKGDRTRKPRTVWGNPIAWREAKTKGSATRASMLRYGFTIIGILGALALAWEFSSVDEPEHFIRPDSFNSTTGVLTVYSKNSFHDYATSRNDQDKTAITLKRTAGDNDPHPGDFIDLHRHAAVEVEVAGNNVLSAITVMPIPHKISEQYVRNGLLAFVMLEFAVILLIVTNAAASTVTREKEDGTLDLLLTTPITSRYYIWGKLRGLVWFVLPLVAVPVTSVVIFILYDIFRFTTDPSNDRWIAFPESIIILPAMLIIVAAFAAILGMQMSLRCKTSVMAVMASLGIVIGACGMFGWCGYEFLNSREGGGAALFAGSFSPFTLMTVLINPYDFAQRTFEDPDQTTNRLTIFIGSFIAVAAYTTVVWAMYRSMVKNFDMTIRRQQR
jgi:ABC-type transport system involved in multi-copper enzyme maturation permease subunit